MKTPDMLVIPSCAQVTRELESARALHKLLPSQEHELRFRRACDTHESRLELEMYLRSLPRVNGY